MPVSSRTLHHVGEWKVELRANTIEEIFVGVARILADAVGPSHSSAPPGTWERVELEASDPAALLVDWANDLIGRSEVAGRAYDNVRNVVIESPRRESMRLL